MIFFTIANTQLDAPFSTTHGLDYFSKFYNSDYHLHLAIWRPNLDTDEEGKVRSAGDDFTGTRTPRYAETSTRRYAGLPPFEWLHEWRLSYDAARTAAALAGP